MNLFEKALLNYDWPGNVRELSNVIERSLSSMEEDTVHIFDLPFYLHRTQKKSSVNSQSSIKEIQTRAEKDAICFALKETNNNKAQAAKILGIHRTLLYKKMKKYNIPIRLDA